MRTLSLNRNPTTHRGNHRGNHLNFTKIKKAHNAYKKAHEHNYHIDVPNGNGTSSTRVFGSTQAEANKKARNKSNKLRGIWPISRPMNIINYKGNRSRSGSRSRSRSRSRRDLLTN